MKTYTAKPGDHIETTIENIIQEAKNQNENIQCDFNGTILIANKNDNKIDLLNAWRNERNRETIEYQNSYEYKQNQIKQLENNRRYQLELNKLLNEFYKSNDINQMLNLIIKIQPLTDNVGIKFDKKEFVKFLNDKGYTRNMNIHPNFNEKDQKNVQEYIMGQIIDMIEIANAIHPITINFINQYKKLFPEYIQLPEDIQLIGDVNINRIPQYTKEN